MYFFIDYQSCFAHLNSIGLAMSNLGNNKEIEAKVISGIILNVFLIMYLKNVILKFIIRSITVCNNIVMIWNDEWEMMSQVLPSVEMPLVL